MNIIISFTGGCMDNTLFASESENDKDTVERYYALSQNGEVGRQFSVPDGCNGFDLYGVVRRLELGNGVIVRAALVGHRSSERTES